MHSPGLVIIGNSAAAVGAVTGVRAVDQKFPITIISKEKEPVYSRPLISYLLGGKVDEKAMLYRPENYHETNRVEARLGVTAKGLDIENRVVKTSRGEAPFEKLLIATGGKPLTPPEIKGLDKDGVFSFTTWKDARDIKAYILNNDVKSALVVGGGLIGLKSVEALSALNIHTTVVELAGRVLSMNLDKQGSFMAEEALKQKGVNLITGTTVDQVRSFGGKVKGVSLLDGRELDCELLIMAIGVIPDLSLVRDTEIATDRGILVDDHLMTSQAGIYAAGDVCQAREMISGEKRCIPIWPGAFRQGFIAGLNITGRKTAYEGGLAMNSVEVAGLPTVSAGLINPADESYEELSHLDRHHGVYRKLVLDEGRLVGFVMVGDIERSGILTGLIKAGVKVNGVKQRLLKRELGVINLPHDYRSHVSSGKGVLTA